MPRTPGTARRARAAAWGRPWPRRPSTPGRWARTGRSGGTPGRRAGTCRPGGIWEPRGEHAITWVTARSVPLGRPASLAGLQAEQSHGVVVADRAQPRRAEVQPGQRLKLVRVVVRDVGEVAAQQDPVAGMRQPRPQCGR